MQNANSLCAITFHYFEPLWQLIASVCISLIKLRDALIAVHFPPHRYTLVHKLSKCTIGKMGQGNGGKMNLREVQMWVYTASIIFMLHVICIDL